MKQRKAGLFAPETDGIGYTCLSEHTDGSAGEEFGTSGCETGREFQDEGDTFRERHGSPGIFVCDRAGTALDKVSAHDSDHEVGACDFPGFFDMIFMPVVKRIIFCDKSCYLHAYLSCRAGCIFMSAGRKSSPGFLHLKKYIELSSILPLKCLKYKGIGGIME